MNTTRICVYSAKFNIIARELDAQLHHQEAFRLFRVASDHLLLNWKLLACPVVQPGSFLTVRLHNQVVVASIGYASGHPVAQLDVQLRTQHPVAQPGTEATCNKMKCKHVQVLHFYISSQFNEEAVSRKRRRIPKFKLCHGMEHHAHEILISDVYTVSIRICVH